MDATDTDTGDRMAQLHQARRPTFMNGTETQVVTRALFAAVPPGLGEPLRSLGLRSVLRRSLSTTSESLAAVDADGDASSIPLVGVPEASAAEPALAPALPAAPQAHEVSASKATIHGEFGPAMPAEFVSHSNVPHPSQPAVDYAERLAAGVAALRLTSERLAEQARSDALELALLVARRILESELSTNVERFFSIIRSVMRRAGESHRVVVRLHPDDVVRVEAVGGARALSSMAVAQIEISGDPDLELGDCMVEADFGVVDGRLTTRLEEMRRLLLEAMSEES